MTVAHRICRSIADHDFFDGQQHYRVSVSIGVASASPTSSDFSPNDFIDQVDQALYQAKTQGRNQVVLYSPKKKYAALAR
jgi:diguanylate cyclase (GGDEF)-like protein